MTESVASPAVLPAHPELRQAVLEPLIDGTRVRCVAVIGAGGHGKSVLVDEIIEELKGAGVDVALLQGDLVVESDPPDSAVVVVDSADHAPASLLAALRSRALDPDADSSVILLARNRTVSKPLAQLVALAERDQVTFELSPWSLEMVESRIPTSASITADQVFELSAGIPVLVDRLCSAWDDDGWPDTVSFGTASAFPDRVVRHVMTETTLLDTEDRVELALRCLVGSDAGAELAQSGRSGRLIEAGLCAADGEIPSMVAAVAPEVLRPEDFESAALAAAVTLINTDPGRAAELLDSVPSANSLAAVSWAACGDFERASMALARTTGRGDDETALAAAAHIAGAESRWGDAAEASRRLESHPYWSPEHLGAVRSLYAALAEPQEVALAAPDGIGVDPSTAFLSDSIGAFRAAFEVTDGPARDAVLERVRGLVRSAPNQVPVLDIPIAGSELAAVTAIALGEFDVARAAIAAMPETTQRSALSGAIDRWLAVRTGGVAKPSAQSTTATTVSSETLDLAAEILESRRVEQGEKLEESSERLADLAAKMSIDPITFDALCELQVGAHRLDARNVGHTIASGLGRFVSELNSPLLWEARLAWNRIESAVAAGDAEAVDSAAAALIDLPGSSEVARPLVEAARSWRDVFAGRVNADGLRAALDLLEMNGYVWEAAALAGQAAIRLDDISLVKELLERGREYRPSQPEPRVTSQAGLSEREIEIGHLVLAGHSYKEIGAQCFISPKTVEHHIAHIRQKLTAVGVPRAEFRARLEADLMPD